jgi:hypothetical protein
MAWVNNVVSAKRTSILPVRAAMVPSQVAAQKS